MKNEPESEFIAEQNICPNCQHEMTYHDKFCAECGQKNQRKIPKLWELLSSFFDSVLNIDSKIFRTFIAICIPGRLTLDFFKGIRKKYYHPFRLFFFVTVLFFTLLGITDLKKELKLGLNVDAFTEAQKDVATYTRIEKKRDTIIAKFEQKIIAGNVLDSLKAEFKSTKEDSITFFMTNNSKRFSFAKQDIIALSGKEILKKYEITDFWEKLFVQQSVKTIKNPADFIWHLIGNLIWMLIFLMPAVALVLKLLYIRRKRYYVEHLTFLFHFHAFIFFIGSLVVVITHYTNFNLLFGIAWIGLAIYLYAAMKRFYKQGWVKTFFKFWFLVFSYGLLSAIFFTLMMIISLAIY